MEVIVLAGGFGTRLQTVLKDLPKPMAPINDRPFLEYLLLNLKSCGLNDFTFCVYHMADKIINYFGDGSKFGVRIKYSIEEQPLDTAGAIGLLKDSIKETFCVVNGDTYLELDIKSCLMNHKKSHAIATIAVYSINNITRYGRIEFDNNGFITEFYEKDERILTGGFINAGLYIFEPEIFKYIDYRKKVSFEKDIFPILLENKKIYSYQGISNFFDIGVQCDYLSFDKWIRSTSARITE